MRYDFLEPKNVEHIVQTIGTDGVCRVFEKPDFGVCIPPTVYVPAGTDSHSDQPRFGVGYSTAIGQQKLDERLLDSVFDFIVPG